jgi:hypothetical protein
VARFVAFAGPRSVQVYEDQGVYQPPGSGGRLGRRVAYRHGDYSGDQHGVNTDEADDALEQLGYLASRWHWDAGRGEWRAAAIPEGQLAGRRAADRRAGGEQQRRVNLEIARTGKRPSGKPLTAEQQRWVGEYKRGRRDFS